MRFCARSIFSLFFSCGCALAAASEPAPPIPLPSPTEGGSGPALRARAHPGTKEMAALLKRFARQLQDPSNSYATEARVQHYQELFDQAENLSERTRAQFLLGKALLAAGREREAVRHLLEAFSIIYHSRENVERETLKEAWATLGMAYLRHGEVENWLEYHSPESCVFPIAGGGIHRITRGSETAIEVYEAMLKEFPEAHGIRYLLNVAYMTLGQYPQGVPPQHLMPPSAIESDYDIPRFPNIAGELGLDVNRLAGGVVMEDLNGDGFLDLAVSSHHLDHPIRFFFSDGRGGFADRTREMRLRGIGGGWNLEHADYDNDGDQDILVLRGGWEKQQGRIPNSLLRNDGDEGFADVTIEAGIYSEYPTRTAAWADFNADGWLDLFIGNESLGLRDPQTGEIVIEDPLGELYVNNGDGTFTEAAAQHGLDARAYVKGVAWGDYDNDGRVDLFLSNAQGGNLLYRNLGPDVFGQWYFQNVAAEAGVELPTESFPTWFWDYDNDGWLDLFVSGYSATRLDSGKVARDAALEYWGLPREAERLWLYRNNGDGTFTDVTEAQNLDVVAYTMGCNFGDLDNDGYLDFYLGTGEPDFQGIVPNRAFRNNKGRGFQEVTAAGGFGNLQKGHGVAFGDLDHDGDQDIYVVMGGVMTSDTFGNLLYENPGSEGSWLVVKLRGTEANRDAIGARIEVVVETAEGSRSVFKNVVAGGSFGSSPLRQAIGLGKARSVVDVKVRWPNETRSVSYGPLEAKQAILIVQGQDGFEELPYPKIEFAKSGHGARHRHGHH